MGVERMRKYLAMLMALAVFMLWIGWRTAEVVCG